MILNWFLLLRSIASNRAFTARSFALFITKFPQTKAGNADGIARLALTMTGSITTFAFALLVGRAASFPIIIPFFVLEALLDIEGNPA